MGLVHIYCGDGKGKTTAAVGLAVRAAGHGLRVCFTQFLKGSPTGEIEILKKLDTVDVQRVEGTTKFVFQMNDREKSQLKQEYTDLLAYTITNKHRYDVLIWDEIIPTYNMDMIGREEVLRFVREKPEQLELVMTGRDPAKELVALADYVSEMKKIKHPYDQGVVAREGIEL